MGRRRAARRARRGLPLARGDPQRDRRRDGRCRVRRDPRQRADRAGDHHDLPARGHASPSADRDRRTPPKPTKPQVDRSKVYVVVFNNSNVTGLAGRVATQASQIGWQVVGSDNWYGTIPASTVYYPKRLERAGKLLALDLGIQRTAPAVDPMRLDRLTVILTGPLD